ncbi:RICIN domain-containing protein [Streptomyces chartreusis]|uniref:RICIN domain-containing protein n=1 Tax=Streptomyces chartreusis TaxID=1969 RepID=UPI00344716BD
MTENEHLAGLTVYEAADAMPDVPALLERARALAAIAVIMQDEWNEQYEIRASQCADRDGVVLRCSGQSRWVQVHFHEDAGTVVFTWDTDADFVPEEPGVWEAIVAQVPQALRPCLWKCDYVDPDSGFPWINSVMWRLPGDTAWRTPDPGSEALRTADRIGYDAAYNALTDLIAPSPGMVLLENGLGVENASFAIGDAIRQVLALRPLTEDIVRTLNPEVSLADVAEEIEALGHRPVRSGDARPLDRGEGEGDPLVMGSRHEPPFMIGLLMPEADGEGFHRVMVHHSGKALTAVGTAVVQSEPHDGDSQKWLLQELGQGPRLRVIAKESGLALQAGSGPGEPALLAEPHDGDEQIFHCRKLYGYGYWAFLENPATELSVTIRPRPA